MSVLTNLLSRLHRVFNRDPQRVPVITLTYEGNMQVAVRDMRLTGPNGLNIDLTELTLAELVDAITDVPGFTASLAANEYGDFLARAILDDGSHDVSQDPYLYFPTSVLWAEMQTYTWTLDEQAQRLRELTKQLYMHTADTDWLEYWVRDHFGKAKIDGESDEEYQRRAIYEIVSLNQNNKALEILIEGALAGSSCEVIDSAADPDARLLDGTRPFTWFRVLVGFNLDEADVSFNGKYDKALEIIKKGKAGGTRLEALEMAGHLTQKQPATIDLGAALAMTEVIEIYPSSSLAFEDDDDIITEDGEDLMK